MDNTTRFDFIVQVITNVILLSLIIFLAMDNLRIRDFYQEADICRLNETTLCGQSYAHGAGVYFFDNVASLARLNHKDKSQINGMYIKNNNDILLVVNRTIANLQETLRHESGHSYFRNNMTEKEHKYVKRLFELACESENEFYAYEYGRYGYFE